MYVILCPLLGIQRWWSYSQSPCGVTAKDLLLIILLQWASAVLSGKESTCVQETQETWVWSLSGEDPLEEGNSLQYWSATHSGNGKPLQYSCLENPMERGATWSHRESDMTEATKHACTHGLFWCNLIFHTTAFQIFQSIIFFLLLNFLFYIAVVPLRVINWASNGSVLSPL